MLCPTSSPDDTSWEGGNMLQVKCIFISHMSYFSLKWESHGVFPQKKKALSIWSWNSLKSTQTKHLLSSLLPECFIQIVCVTFIGLLASISLFSVPKAPCTKKILIISSFFTYPLSSPYYQFMLMERFV